MKTKVKSYEEILIKHAKMEYILKEAEDDIKNRRLNLFDDVIKRWVERFG